MQPVTNDARSTRRRDERGFTLPELLVVLLVVAILIAIAVPAYLAVTSGANDRRAQSNLVTSLIATLAAYSTPASFKSITSTSLDNAEPSLTFVQDITSNFPPPTTCKPTPDTCDSRGPENISWKIPFSTPQGQVIILAALAASGTCWYVMTVEGNLSTAQHGQTLAGTYYGKNRAACRATNAPTSTTLGGAGNWALSFASVS